MFLNQITIFKVLIYSRLYTNYQISDRQISDLSNLDKLKRWDSKGYYLWGDSWYF